MAAFAPLEQSLGAPGDVFSTDVPVLGGDSPAPRAMAAGDTGVSTQTGAFQFRYPIEVPPGRLGVQPSLALHYSSQGSIHGGIAAGWSLDLPEIRIDSRQSRLALQDPFVEERYESSLAGGHRLIPVSEPAAADVQATFRAQNDPSYARYERLTTLHNWRVKTQDGQTHYFGESDHIGNVPDPTRFVLTRTQDEYGNTVHYFWQPIHDGAALVDHVLQRIEYTTNSAAGLTAHARVFFDYVVPQSCGVGSSFPVGALLDQRAGLRYRGSRQLTAIRTEARSGAGFRPVRNIALTYSDEADDCGQNHGPLRILTGIQETATAPGGQTTTKPAVTFAYGPLERSLVSVRSFSSNDDPDHPGIHAGRRFPFNAPLEGWPSLDSTLVDIDGDGRPDRLESEGCSVSWWRNTGDGFDFIGELDVPTFRLADLSDCSLAGQFTRFTNRVPPGNPIYCLQFNKGAYLAYRFLDMNGDGLPELVAALHYDEVCYDPLADAEAMSRWNMGPCEPPNPGNKRRALESCNGFPWEIYWNLGGGNFDMENRTVVHQPVPLESDAGDSSLGGGRSTHGMGIMSSSHAVIDIDGDGYLDGVRTDPDSPGHWHVFRGDGTGQFWPRSDSFPYRWARPEDAPMAQSTTSVTGPHIGGKWRGHVRGRTAFVELNADGIVDLLWTDTDLDPPETFTYLGTGTGFRTGLTGDPANREIPLGTSSIRYSRTVGTDIELPWGTRSAWRFPFDYDQDGRSDFYLKDQIAEGDPPSTSTELRFGDGSGSRTAGGPPSAAEIARIPQILEVLPDDEGRWHVRSDFLDIDGDGVTEFVEREGNDLRLYQDQRDGQPMRLLNRIENGAGGRIDIRYRASTDRQIDIAGTDDRLGMPYHTWLVELVLTSGLVDQVGATQYRYGRPIWNRDARGRWGFRGFDRVQETHPGGSVVEYRHDYTLDWSGRLVERAIHDDPEPGQPGLRIDSIESTTWQRFALFQGAVASYQVVDQKERKCSGAQTYDQCLASGALSVETTTWEPQTSYWDESGPALLFAATVVWRKRGDVIANGDRRTRKRYYLFSREDRYRIRPLNELTDERQGGSNQLRARTEYAYDIEGNKWHQATRYNSDGTQATDYTWLEHPTGQVSGRRKPVQFAGGLDVRSRISYVSDRWSAGGSAA